MAQFDFAESINVSDGKTEQIQLDNPVVESMDLMSAV